MKNIVVLFFLALFLTCNNSSFSNNEDFYNNSDQENYINLQVKIHSVYSLFKAFNAGVITQEEYDNMRTEILK